MSRGGKSEVTTSGWRFSGAETNLAAQKTGLGLKNTTPIRTRRIIAFGAIESRHDDGQTTQLQRVPSNETDNRLSNSQRTPWKTCRPRYLPLPILNLFSLRKSSPKTITRTNGLVPAHLTPGIHRYRSCSLWL
jgi:hypothetical protein